MQSTSKNPNFALGIKEFLKSVDSIKPLENDTYEAARAVISQLQSAQDFEDDVERNDYEIQIDTEQTIPVRIVRHPDKKGDLPIIFYIHGGGWIAGDRMTYDSLLRSLAKGTRGAVIFAEYTRVPEARYPTQLKELWKVFESILNNPGKYNVNPYKIVMAGDGTGANMAAVLTNYARKQGVNVNYQLLLYPTLDANLSLDSYRQFKQGPWITKETMQWFWDSYLPDINMRNQAPASPLLIPEHELKGLPDTLVITAENDITRDDGEEYARKLSDAGVNAVAVRFLGTIHDFLMLEGLAHTAPTRICLHLINTTLHEVLWGT